MYSEAALRQLEQWGVSDATAQAVGLFSVPSASQVYPDFKPVSGLVIPYYGADKQLMTFDPGARPFCRVRYLETPSGFQKAYRYGQPARSGTRAYFPLLLDWRKLLADPAEPLIITEGEAKALVACAAGFPCLALGGVYNFGGEAFLPELEAAQWSGRETFIVFDSDAATNPNVLTAEARLVDELQRKRGARCHIVRLPPADDGGKVGLDDYLKAHGAAAFTALLRAAPPLGALDAKVLSLNRSVAWIEKENLIYDLETHNFMPKDAFTVGSRFSAFEHVTVGSKQRSEPKRISVAKTWLTHPHAQRFAEVLFRPGEGATVQTAYGRPALNLWTGWDAEPVSADDPRVAAWLQLTKHLFSTMPPEHRDIPLKWLAYKAQHPERKVDLALVLIGPQGCGKSLWGECVRDAFKPYGTDVTPQSLASEFQGWLERTLIALIDETKGEDIWKAREQIKALISNLERPMNEKFRPARIVRTYTQYIILSNNRAVGAYSGDDRRMIVVDCPPPLRTPEGAALYRYLGVKAGEWHKQQGPRALLGYLLHLDLQGWEPPARAPETPEKHMAHMESLTPVQQIAEDMLHATDSSVAERWVKAARAWANQNATNSNSRIAAQAQATLEATPNWPIRPWYEPRELALMFPHLIATQLGSKHDQSTPAGLISRELRDAGIPYLVCKDNPRGFLWQGRVRQYLVVSDFEDWATPLAQAEFERLMHNCPTYGGLKR